MTYIENIFICLSVPILLSLPLIGAKERKYAFFLCLGMLLCLIASYFNSYFIAYYGVDATTGAIEITPLCEEIIKFLPLIIYILTFEPKSREIMICSVAVATGFATFENVCYMTVNGAENLMFLAIRGLSAGALHILCGIAIGKGLSFAFNKKWLTYSGIVGTLGMCITFHAIYNLLITANNTLWQEIGYIFPCLLIIVFCIFTKIVSINGKK
ncbi:MAG: PrsW family glutamic-type intramembrane protease [Eubacteriaceae bacterium]|nr:PrsW family glutamic-type intramembrane protease [Eubacteriaceae bacterium]